jgi:hypothetical protein
MFEAKASNKLEWIKQRLIEICLGIENIAMWDNIYRVNFKKESTSIQSDFAAQILERS